MHWMPVCVCVCERERERELTEKVHFELQALKCPLITSLSTIHFSP